MIYAKLHTFYIKSFICQKLLTKTYILTIYLKTHFHILDKPIKYVKFLLQICFTEQPVSFSFL